VRSSPSTNERRSVSEQSGVTANGVDEGGDAPALGDANDLYAE